MLLNTAAFSQEPPTVDELILRAIESLENTSFEGRMRYADPYGNGQEKLVDILFLSPSDFRVQPLISEKQKAGYYFIENSSRLVKIYGDGTSVVEMPERQFIIDNLMRRRLLEALAGRENVNLLQGRFNGEPVWILREEGGKSGNYSITIHISEHNDYPISLEMIGFDGKRLQYYELEEVEFLSASDIPEGSFRIPGNASLLSSPLEDAPEMADIHIPETSKAGREQEGELEYKPRQRGKGESDDAAKDMQRIPFPMLPTWMPEGYSINAIMPLDYSERDGDPMLVYQLELYNPYKDEVISIFETRSSALEEVFGAGRSVGDEGYFVSSNEDGWLVAVFGKVSESQFDLIFESLEKSDELALEIISRTMSREELRRWAEDVCTREGNPVP